MPRKKKTEQLPDDLEALLDDDSQDDLRDPDDIKQEQLDVSGFQSIQQAYALVARTPEGQAVLRDVLNLTRYQAGIGCQPGEVVSYLNGSRDVWVAIKGRLKPDVLRVIEYPLEVSKHE